MTRNRFTTILASAALVALSALGVAAAGSASTSTTTSKATSARSATVKVANSHLGKILVNSQGHTLYLFKKDKGTKSSCNGACAKAWPPLRTRGKPVIGSGASASKAGTTKRSDGTRQVTYNGHPLYTFVKDTKAGQTNGEGLTAFGGSWFAVSPAGNQASAHSAKPRPAPKTSSPSHNGIPQHGGGDGDSDNNGGPSDGDGNI
jgi:predicted lipoprotein with Yx(FWY)xxD motif